MTTESIDNRISRIEATLPHLATKADVESLRTDMIAGDAALRTDMETLRGEFKSDIESLRTEIYQHEARLIKWMIGSVVTASIGASSLTFAALTLLGA